MTKNVILDKELVSELFENATHQGDVLIGLYRLVYPDWDSIASVDGFPKINDATWKYICLKFQTLDAKFHPDVLPGGAWLNNGFSGDHGYNPDLPDFTVIPAPVTYMEMEH